LKESNGFENLFHSRNGSMYSFQIKHLPAPKLCIQGNKLTTTFNKIEFLQGTITRAAK